MAFNAKKIGNNDQVVQPVIEAGVYPARIVGLIDMGVQPQRPYQGQEKPPMQEINITYELVDSFMVDKDGKELEDKPRQLSETIPLHNLIAEKAKSTQRYNAADPNNLYDGDFSKLVDTPVNVSIVHNQQGEKIYVNIASIATMRPKDAEKCPALKNPIKVFDLDEPDMEVFASFPKWIQEKIVKNLKFNGSKLQAALGGKAEAPKKLEAEEEDAPW